MFTRIDNLPEGIVGVVASGQVTADDRRRVLEPTIEDTVEAAGRVRLLYVAGPDFAGYDRGGLYDDAVFGTRHFNHFDRIAFVVNDGPYQRAVLAMNGLMPAHLRIFAPAEFLDAEEWLMDSLD
jgi:hypothetical protein